MSWKDFYRLIEEQNTDVTAWKAAIDANPNTSEDALKVALMEIYERNGVDMLDKFTAVVIAMARNADALLATILEQEGFIADMTFEPVVVIGQDGPGEKYDMPGLFDLSVNGASASVVSLS